MIPLLYTMSQLLVPPKPLGLERAYVMVNCESGCEQFVMEHLGLIGEIKEIATTIGAYDIISKIEVPSTEILSEIIALKIRKIPHVRSTTTIVCGL